MSFKKIFFPFLFLLFAFGCFNYFTSSDSTKRDIQQKILSWKEILVNKTTNASSAQVLDASRIVPRIDADPDPKAKKENNSLVASQENSKINQDKSIGTTLSSLRQPTDENNLANGIPPLTDASLASHNTALDTALAQSQKATGQVKAIDKTSIAGQTDAMNEAGRQGIAGNAIQGSSSTLEASGKDKKENSVIMYTNADQKGPGNSLRGKVTANVATNDGYTSLGTAYSVTEDAVVQRSFIEDLASFLTTNYWPIGEHPLAKKTPYSSITLSWINSRYGNSFKGLGTRSPEPTLEREKVLSYILTPSMVTALSELYGEMFIDALQRDGVSRFNDAKKTTSHVAQMLTFYSQRIKAVSLALKGFLSAPEAREKAKLFSDAEIKVQKAYKSYNDIRYRGKEDNSQLRISAKDYQTAIWLRDQAKTRLASVMRRSADTRLLSEGDITFIALWLSRRDTSNFEGIASFADALEGLALQMQKRAGTLSTGRSLHSSQN